jgi:hypothetical protein
MQFNKILPLAAAMMAAGLSGATAQDAGSSIDSGSFAIWKQGALPGTYEFFYEGESESVCEEDPEGGNDVCLPAFGFGGQGKIYFDKGIGIQLETLADYHGSLHFERDEDEDDGVAAFYKAVGIHGVKRSGDLAFGAFGGLSYTTHMADDEDPAKFAFGGAETALFGDTTTFYGQIGVIGLIDEDLDTLANMAFATMGARFYLDPNSVIGASASVGLADDYDGDADPDEKATAVWLQLATNYERKIEDSNMSWTIGYQGDLVYTDEEECCSESAWVHTVKAGIVFNIDDTLQGADRNGSRTFSLPNLRAPASYAATLN